MVNLNTLVPASAGVNLTNAIAINNAGEILCAGSESSGDATAFLLKPPADPNNPDVPGTGTTPTPTPTPTPTSTNTSALTPTLGKTTVPTAVVSGAKLKGSVTITITNSSTAKVKGTDTFDLYATTDGAVDSASVLVGSVKRALTLAASRSATVTIPVSAGAPGAGTYTLLPKVVDASGGTSVAASGPTVTVAAPFASLSGTVGSVAPVATTPGKTLSFTLTITNAGNVDATGKATLAVYLSADGVALTIPITPTVTKSLTVKPGKPLAVRLKVKVPAGTAAGHFFPLVSFAQGSNVFTEAAGTPVVVG
jgi:hypothetical protein